jgi:CubicO group peptidase (beta-lactamase class C family)
VQPDGGSGTGYGYQWWLGDVTGRAGDGHPTFAAVGYAGQLIEVVPDLKLVVAVSCLDGPGAFDSADLSELVSEHVIPAVTG